MIDAHRHTHTKRSNKMEPMYTFLSSLIYFIYSKNTQLFTQTDMQKLIRTSKSKSMVDENT